MMTVTERYMQDSHFRVLVDTIQALIHDARYTPTEIREAAILAQTLYEQRTIRPHILIPVRELDQW